MALFNVDLRRESVKAAHAFGSMLGERVNKAAWKSYIPEIVDLIIAADRGDETAADKVDALLVDSVTMNDLIALGAACKVVGVIGADEVYRIVVKLSTAAQNDPEYVSRLEGALGGYQRAMAFARVADETESYTGPTEDECVAAGRSLAAYIERARATLSALVEATAKASKAKQLAILNVYAEAACGAVASPDMGAFDSTVNYRAQFQAAVAAEMEAAHVPSHVIEAYRVQSAASNIADDAIEDAATAGWQNV